MPRLTDALSLVWSLLATAVRADLNGFTCDKVRSTGYSNHRKLHVPVAMWDSAGQNERTWADKLCCVYTWVVRDAKAQSPYMITYDGGRRSYGDATSFAHAAERAYSAICGMSMGSRDCATAADRCPVTTTPIPVREYDAVGMLCRPKNADGYARSTQVVSAAACREKCEADAERCGAFEYEYVSGDDRECELHEKTIISRSESEAMGTCLLSTSGDGDPLLDLPILGQYRCCWMKEFKNSSILHQNASNQTVSSTAQSSHAFLHACTSMSILLLGFIACITCQ